MNNLAGVAERERGARGGLAGNSMSPSVDVQSPIPQPIHHQMRAPVDTIGFLTKGYCV